MKKIIGILLVLILIIVSVFYFNNSVSAAISKTITFPVEGQTLNTGGKYDITWDPNALNSSEVFLLAYGYSGGFYIVPIASNANVFNGITFSFDGTLATEMRFPKGIPVSPIPNNGKYTWTVPSVFGGESGIKIMIIEKGTSLKAITDYVNLNPQNQTLVYVKDPILNNPNYNNSVIQTPTVISPNGNEKIQAGTTFPIKWNSANISNNTFVKIELTDTNHTPITGNWSSTDVAKAYGQYISVVVPNTGSYDWAIPYDVQPGQYLISIKGWDSSRNVDYSDSSFTITKAEPTIAAVNGSTRLLNPSKANEVAIAGGKYRIYWNYALTYKTNLTRIFFVDIENGNYKIATDPSGSPYYFSTKTGDKYYDIQIPYYMKPGKYYIALQTSLFPPAFSDFPLTISSTGVATQQVIPTPPCHNYTRNLSVGDAGDDVSALHDFLYYEGYKVYTVKGGKIADNKFTKENYTYSFLLNFQTRNFLPQTGILDEATRNYLNSLCGNTQAPVTPSVVNPPVTLPQIPTISKIQNSLGDVTTIKPGENVSIFGSGFDGATKDTIFIKQGIGEMNLDVKSVTSSQITFVAPNKASGKYNLVVLSNSGESAPYPITINNPTIVSNPSTLPCYNFTRNLSRNDTGTDVTALQNFLAYQGYAFPTITNLYGGYTEGYLLDYQGKVGLTKNGKFDLITRNYINALCGYAQTPTTPVVNPPVVNPPVVVPPQSSVTSISSMSPTTAKAGDIVTLTGQGFSGIDITGVYLKMGNSEVSPASVTSNANTITFKVPNIPLGSYTISVVGNSNTATAPSTLNLYSNSAAPLPVMNLVPVTNPVINAPAVNPPAITQPVVTQPVTPVTPPSTGSCIDKGLGAKGTDVLNAQKFLSGLGYYVSTSGTIDTLTSNVLRDYQQYKVQIPVTGVLDTATRNKMGIQCTTNGAAIISIFDWFISLFR